MVTVFMPALGVCISACQYYNSLFNFIFCSILLWLLDCNILPQLLCPWCSVLSMTLVREILPQSLVLDDLATSPMLEFSKFGSEIINSTPLLRLPGFPSVALGLHRFHMFVAIDLQVILVLTITFLVRGPWCPMYHLDQRIILFGQSWLLLLAFFIVSAGVMLELPIDCMEF